ncbi:MAG TPA: hypothetical protein VFB16_08350 [Bauldia sp.]|nr:hypothetical protein [Bauldia sp.]
MCSGRSRFLVFLLVALATLFGAGAARADDDDGIPLDLADCAPCQDLLGQYQKAFNSFEDLNKEQASLPTRIKAAEDARVKAYLARDSAAYSAANEDISELNDRLKALPDELKAARAALEQAQKALEKCLRLHCFDKPPAGPGPTDAGSAEPCKRCVDEANRLAAVIAQAKSLFDVLLGVEDAIDARKAARAASKKAAEAAALKGDLDLLDQQRTTIKRTLDTLLKLRDRLRKELEACRKKNCPEVVPKTGTTGGEPPVDILKEKVACESCKGRQAAYEDAAADLARKKKTAAALKKKIDALEARQAKVGDLPAADAADLSASQLALEKLDAAIKTSEAEVAKLKNAAEDCKKACLPGTTGKATGGDVKEPVGTDKKGKPKVGKLPIGVHIGIGFGKKRPAGDDDGFACGPGDELCR